MPTSYPPQQGDEEYDTLTEETRVNIPSSGDSVAHEKQSLLEKLLPDPTQPQYAVRTLVVGVASITLFVVVIAFLFTNGPSDEEQLETQLRGIGWIVYSDVAWGGTFAAAKNSTHRVKGGSKNSTIAAAKNVTAASTSAAAVSLTSNASDLSDFVWHKRATLNPNTYDDNIQAYGTPSRLVVVGDIHGHVSYLDALLDRISFNPEKDTLVHTGDVVTKAEKVSDSLETLELLQKLNATGVRGNHDQKVIEWRNFFTVNNVTDFSLSAKQAKKRYELPEGFKWGDKNFNVARYANDAGIAYLKSLPLTLYFEELNTFVVHAGLMLWPEASPYFDADANGETSGVYSSSTDSALPDILTSTNASRFVPSPELEENMRKSPARSILLATGNTDATGSLIHVQTVSESGGEYLADDSSSTPWYTPWNDNMMTRTCRSVVCPNRFNVIYGHWSEQDLNIRDTTFGLDSGCFDRGKLSALVLNANEKYPLTSSPLSYSIGIGRRDVERNVERDDDEEAEDGEDDDDDDDRDDDSDDDDIEDDDDDDDDDDDADADDDDNEEEKESSSYEELEDAYANSTLLSNWTSVAENLTLSSDNSTLLSGNSTLLSGNSTLLSDNSNSTFVLSDNSTISLSDNTTLPVTNITLTHNATTSDDGQFTEIMTSLHGRPAWVVQISCTD